MNQEPPKTDNLYLTFAGLPADAGIFHYAFKKRMRNGGPVLDLGNARERTRVRVYRICEKPKKETPHDAKQHGENGKKPKYLWRVYWYEAGCRQPKTMTRRNEKVAEFEANRIYRMLNEGKVDADSLDEKTIFSIREAEDIVAGHNVTFSEVARRFMALLAQTPPGTTVESIFQRGMAASVLDAKFNEPMAVLKPIFLGWAETQQKLSPATIRSYSTTLDKIGEILNGRAVSEINTVALNALISRHGGKSMQAKAELGRCNVFLEWARGFGYFREVAVLPTEFIKLPKGRIMAAPVKIYSASTLLDIIRQAPETLRAALILVATSLFRPEEAMAMTYEQLNLHEKDNWIWIPPSIAKRVGNRTCARWNYLNPITRHLLSPYMKNKGPFCPGIPNPTSGNARFSEFMKKAKIDVLHDGIRKSCISAFAAIDVPVVKVAKWAGNSEAVIQGHYNLPSCTVPYTKELAAGFLGVAQDDPSIEKIFEDLRTRSASPAVPLVATDLINRVR